MSRDDLPTKEVSRAEAAKIIAYLMVGDAEEADALKTTSDPFSDVSKNHWAAGYIAYLVQEGVINGKGDGTFDPDGEVTGLAFGKMLLTALGYGVNDEYVGENWSINVAKDALQYGIYDGNLAGAGNDPATREECALYAFNTLELNKVTYSALLGGYIENSTAWKNNAESNKADTFANDFDLEPKTLEEDAFWRPEGYVWTIGGRKVISGAYGQDANLIASYTTPVSGNEVYNLLGKSIVKGIDEDKYELNVYVDGMEEYPTWDIAKANSDELAYTGYGVETYVYLFPEYNKDGDIIDYEVRVCVINTYLAQVTDVQEETKKKDAETSVEYAKDVPGYLEDNTYETEDYAEGELVLVTYSQKNGEEGIQSMVPATLLEGKITKYTNKGVAKITADGETYTGAYNDYVVDGQRAREIVYDDVKGQTYTLILDEYGYVIGIVEPAGAPADYVYVSQFGQKIDTTSSLSDKTTLSAKVWYVDEESETGVSSKIVLVDYTASKDALADAAGFNPESFDDNYSSVVDVLNNTENNTKNTTINGGALGLYTMTMENGKAVLGNVGWADLSGAGTDAKINKGISRFFDGDDKHYATTKTQFFYVDGLYPKESVTLYTGINKVPTLKSLDHAYAIEGFRKAVEGEGNTWAYNALLVDYAAKEKTVTSDNYFYLGTYFKAENENGKYDVSLDVMKDGELTTLDFTGLSTGAADKLIKAVEAYEMAYLTKKGAADVQDVADGKIVYMDKKDGELVIYEMYKVGDVYETTLYVDGEAIPTYMENAEIVDLREYTDEDDYEIGSLSMNGLAKLVEKEDVTVAFQYNEFQETTVIYVIDSVEKTEA